MKCNVKSCKNKVEYIYQWEQSLVELEINLCVYCMFQIKAEMLKQQCYEELAVNLDSLGKELDSNEGKK